MEKIGKNEMTESVYRHPMRRKVKIPFSVGICTPYFFNLLHAGT